MGRKPKYTASERLAKLRAEEAKLMAELAFEGHSDSPSIIYLAELEEGATSDFKKASLAFSQTSNNVDFKILSSRLKIEKYAAERELYLAMKSEGQALRETLSNLMLEFANKREAFGEDISDDQDASLLVEAMESVETLREDSQVAALQAEAIEAKSKYDQFRRDFASGAIKSAQLSNVTEE